MSIPVDVAHLATSLRDFGAGYLLTTRDGTVKVISAVPVLADGVLRVTAPGRGSVANVGDEPRVTLLYPPLDAPGFTLLVDGAAVVDGDDVVVTPTSAILHKPAR